MMAPEGAAQPKTSAKTLASYSSDIRRALQLKASTEPSQYYNINGWENGSQGLVEDDGSNGVAWLCIPPEEMVFKTVLTRSFSGISSGFTCKSAARQPREPGINAARRVEFEANNPPSQRYNHQRLQRVNSGNIVITASPEKPTASSTCGSADNHLPRARVLMQQLGDSLAAPRLVATTRSTQSVSMPGFATHSSGTLQTSNPSSSPAASAPAGRPPIPPEPGPRVRSSSQYSSPYSARKRTGSLGPPSSVLLPSSWADARHAKAANAQAEHAQPESMPLSESVLTSPDPGVSATTTDAYPGTCCTNSVREVFSGTPEMQQQRLQDQERAAIQSLAGRDYDEAEASAGWEDEEVHPSCSTSGNNKRSSVFNTAVCNSHKDSAQAHKGGAAKSAHNGNQRRPEPGPGVPDPRDQEYFIRAPSPTLFLKNLTNLRPTTSYMRESVAAARSRLRAAHPEEDTSGCRAMVQLPAMPAMLGGLDFASSGLPSGEDSSLTQDSQSRSKQLESSDSQGGCSTSETEVRVRSKSRSRCNSPSQASCSKSRAKMLANLSSMIQKVSQLSGGVPVTVEDMSWMEKCCSPEMARRAERRLQSSRVPGVRGSDGILRFRTNSNPLSLPADMEEVRQECQNLRLQSKPSSISSEIMSMIQGLEAYEIHDVNHTPRALLSLNSMERISQKPVERSFKPSIEAQEYSCHMSRLHSDKLAASAAQPFVRFGLCKKSLAMARQLAANEA